MSGGVQVPTLNIAANSCVRRTRILYNVYTIIADPLLHCHTLRIRSICQALHRVVGTLQDVCCGRFALVVRLGDEPLDVRFTRRGNRVDRQAR